MATGEYHGHLEVDDLKVRKKNRRPNLSDKISIDINFFSSVFLRPMRIGIIAENGALSRS